ncbi:unnamed protein product [Durusdinium trenchii]|uniref:Uncharacterized protein n=1 Tax=Durusdinium trenchii TaxID=1381693 RepID=A0ABP0L2W0_9DINO|eukprot:g18127.t1
MGCCSSASASAASAGSIGVPKHEKSADQVQQAESSMRDGALEEICLEQIEVQPAAGDGLREGQREEPSAPEASLKRYFEKDYKEGGVFAHEEYEHDAADWCWLHKGSNIKVPSM